MLFKSKGSQDSVKAALKVGTALAGALVAASMASAAHAQTPAASTDSQVAEDEAIVVTGSHIVRPGFTSSSPISTIGADDIARQQPVNIEEILRAQPQFASGNAAQVNNGGSGATTLDLRGLTEPRTLPLVEGHRMPGFDPNGLFDVSAVPLGLLERVDVVTGGASAVYGSDAVAGVVNFVLNENFQGMAVRADHSWNDLHDSGDTNSAEVTMGAGLDDGRGNVSLDVAWMDRQPVFQVKGPASLAPGASSFSTPASFDNIDPTPNGRNDNDPNGSTSSGSRTQLDANGNLAGDGVTPGTGSPYHFFDFNGQNLYQQPQTRWTATALAHYDLTPNVQAYARLIYNHSTATTQLASTPVGVKFDIPLDNAFLTPEAATYLAAHNGGSVACPEDPTRQCVNVNTRWRAVEVGPRESTYLYQTFQALGGFRGDIGDSTWKYDVTFAHGETSLDRQQNNDVNQDKMQQALFTDSTTQCSAGADAGCAPLNLFNPSLGGITPAAAQFIRLNLGVQSRFFQDYFTGVINGDLGDIKSPWAHSPIGMAVGVEYRREEVNFLPDFASQAGISPGFGPTLPVRGHYDVSEAYTEALVPVVEDAPFAKSINLELGYRTSDYSSSGRVESYKYGGDWTPVDGYRFRAMFQRAVRAPNLNELFGPLTSGTGDLLSDPCVAPTDAGVNALCIATGVPNPANLSTPTAGQVNNFSGGNTNLKPETADTITVGFVLNPPMLSGLRATVDYFDIKIDQAIAIRPLSDIADGCYNPARNTTLSPTAADCLLITRDPTTGLLDSGDNTGITQITQNIGSVHVEGIDYGVNYTWDLDNWGSLTLGIDGTHLLTTSYTPSSGGREIDCIGFYGKECGLPSTTAVAVGGPVSEDKFIQHGVWSFGKWEFGYRWRYLSAVDVDPATKAHLSDLIGDPDFEAKSSHIDAMNYFDLSAAWQVTDAVRLSAAVTNVTNEDAPFVFTGTGSTPFNSGNTYPSTYDVLGRVFTIGASAKF